MSKGCIPNQLISQRVFGEHQTSYIPSTPGNDLLTGTCTNGVIKGFAGNDTINAFDGDDGVDGGGDNVENFDIPGRSGADRFDVTGAIENMRIDMSAGEHEHDEDGLVNGFVTMEWVTSGAGNDSLTGAVLGNMLDRGAGEDLIERGDSDDPVNGGLHNDIIVGGAGLDALFGDDLFVFESGNGIDQIDGGSGTDTFDVSGIVVRAQIDLAAETHDIWCRRKCSERGLCRERYRRVWRGSSYW